MLNTKINFNRPPILANSDTSVIRYMASLDDSVAMLTTTLKFLFQKFYSYLHSNLAQNKLFLVLRHTT